MRAALGWLAEYAALPAGLDGRGLAELLIVAGLEVETVEQAGAEVTGPLVLGRVVSYEVETHSNGKSIRYCRVDVGRYNDEAGNEVSASRGIVCGAHNFVVGDTVVVALPGAVLPGGFAIAARKTYGHISDGMICSARELGLGDDHSGIIVLSEPSLVPGADAAEALFLRDDVLDVAVTPDRGYAMSIRGLAREAAQAVHSTFRDPVDRVAPAPVSTGYPVELGSTNCPLFVALSVTGIDPSRPSPRWLARRVQLAGMRSISLAVDITNYVMLETGQPIHAYDAERLSGPIVVRQALPGERLTTLDGTDRALDPADLLITDDSGPIGLAGVMGGESSELSPTTTSVVIEAAHFDQMTIARTSRRHKLASEASRRFERGVDPAAAYAAAHRVAALLVEHAGGTLDAAETVAGRVPAEPTCTFPAGLSEHVLGTPVSHDREVALLEQVGVSIEQRGDDLVATPPSWRPDLRDPYDYVEEVGRLIGFGQIAPILPPAPTGRGRTPAQRARRAVNAALAAAGFVEVITLPFVSAEEVDRLGAGPDDRRRDLVRLLNPLAETSPYLRTTLLPGLFAAAARNTSRSNDDLALFEAGSVFLAARPAVPAPRPPVDRRPDQATLDAMDAAIGNQPRHCAALLAGWWVPPGWRGPGVHVDWQHAVAFAEVAARAVGVELRRVAAEQAPWHPGRCAALLLPDGTVIGHAGELHPRVLTTFGLPPRSAAVEFDLDALVAAAPGAGEIRPVAAYPVVKEDVALVVDEAVPVAEVYDALRAGAGEYLESVELFDVYHGPQIGAGKKSLAFGMRFRAVDRTLTVAEVAPWKAAAVSAAAERTGAIQRVD